MMRGQDWKASRATITSQAKTPIKTPTASQVWEHNEDRFFSLALGSP